MIAELVKAGLGGFEEVELPDWLGEALYSDENGVLIKGAGHKYIRRVPKAGGGWRYFYNVTGGHGLGHHAEMVRGASFKVKDAGKEGHFHVEEDHGDEVTIKHDESGKTSRVSKKALAGMLHAEHAEAVGKVRARVTANLEQAKKTGSAKQQERAAALVSKYGGASEGDTGGEDSKPLRPSGVGRRSSADYQYNGQDISNEVLTDKKGNFFVVVAPLGQNVMVKPIAKTGFGESRVLSVDPSTTRYPFVDLFVTGARPDDKNLREKLGIIKPKPDNAKPKTDWREQYNRSVERGFVDLQAQMAQSPSFLSDYLPDTTKSGEPIIKMKGDPGSHINKQQSSVGVRFPNGLDLEIHYQRGHGQWVTVSPPGFWDALRSRRVPHAKKQFTATLSEAAQMMRAALNDEPLDTQKWHTRPRRRRQRAPRRHSLHAPARTAARAWLRDARRANASALHGVTRP